MPQNPETLVELYRKNYPDLTAEEEAQIRRHAETDCGLFFRCKFEASDVGHACGIKFSSFSQ